MANYGSLRQKVSKFPSFPLYQRKSVSDAFHRDTIHHVVDAIA